MSDETRISNDVGRPLQVVSVSPTKKAEIVEKWRRMLALRQEGRNRFEIRRETNARLGDIDLFFKKIDSRVTRRHMSEEDALLDLAFYLDDHGKTRKPQNFVDSLPPELQQQHEQFVANLISDLGGADELSEMEKMYVRQLARLEILSLLVGVDLARRGWRSPKGKVRGASDYYLRIQDRLDRFAQRLGMKRRAKNANDSIADWIAAQSREGASSDMGQADAPDRDRQPA